MASEIRAPRRLGRPPKDSNRVATADRLIDAAFHACIEQGLYAVSMADVASRAGVTPNAV